LLELDQQSEMEHLDQTTLEHELEQALEQAL
jgi:hypothetical protein